MNFVLIFLSAHIAVAGESKRSAPSIQRAVQTIQRQIIIPANEHALRRPVEPSVTFADASVIVAS